MSSMLTSIKNNFGKYLCKGVGLAALGSVFYDSHVIGKLQADVYSKSKDADACMETFNNTQYLSSQSMTTSNAKKMVHNLEVESNMRHFFNSAIGYFKGFGSMLINNVVPLGLGIGALFGKKGWRAASAIGLGIYTGFKLFKDVLGFGHYNDLNKKY